MVMIPPIFSIPKSTCVLALALGGAVMLSAADPAPAIPEPAVSPASAPDPRLVPFDFSDSKVGEEPEGGFVIDGSVLVIEGEAGARGLEIGAEPLVEAGAMIGDSARGGAMIAATVVAESKRRSHPRFGIGVHGISGYRIRVVPAQKVVELVFKEETVASVPLDWKAGQALRLELVVLPGENEEAPWSIEARAWYLDEERPEKPTFTREDDSGLKGQGKPSLWGSPYAGLPIRFTEIHSWVQPLAE